MLLHIASDVCFPGSCLSCGTLLTTKCNDIILDDIDGDFFCHKCSMQLKKIDKCCCKRCGYPLKKENFLDKKINYCVNCEKFKYYFNISRSCYEYKGIIRKILLHFKFYFSTDALSFIGLSLYLKYKNELNKADVVCFVPITRTKLFLKGFNHAGLITNMFMKYAKNEKCDIVLLNDLFVKLKKTQQSKKLSQFERLHKHHFFGINKKYLVDKYFTLNGKNILIIDDIMTTGSTLNELSFLIGNKYPKANIECLTFARTMLY